ncbi:cupin domain-containing protein [Bradyrhizobium sp. USDA 4473]
MADDPSKTNRAACAQAMTVQRAGSGVMPGPSGYATGPFFMQILLSSQNEGEMTALRAYFQPGAASLWHSHPRGQLLFVLDGVGFVEREGGEVTEVRAGDSIWFAPGERHRHGATEQCPFSYLSVQPVKDGCTVTWDDSATTHASN